MKSKKKDNSKQSVLEAISDLAEAVGARFDVVDKEIKVLDKKIDGVDSKLDRKFDGLQDQITRIETYILDNHQRRLAVIEKKLGIES